jgi:hypothetical protein
MKPIQAYPVEIRGSDGGLLAYRLPGMDEKLSEPSSPPSMFYQFYVGTILLIFTSLVTIGAAAYLYHSIGPGSVVARLKSAEIGHRNGNTRGRLFL